MLDPYLSAVIPLYNEEENIKPLCETLSKVMDNLHKSYEIIFVNDGSFDGTLKELRQAKETYSHLRIISFEKNAGQSAAFDAGLRAARGEIIITLDGDMQNDPRDIEKMLGKLEEGKADAVVGWRQKRQDNFIRRFVSRIANMIRALIADDNFKDTGCSLKVMKRSALQNIKLYNGMHRFLSSLLKMEGYKVIEIPVNHFPRTRGKGKYTILGRILKVLTDLCVLRWMKNRHLNYKIIKEE
jgi:glycosyltransferase involved in cell wall biosynthesis